MNGSDGSEEMLDLLVVGAGPCGIAVGVAALRLGLRCRVFDRGAVTQAMLEHPLYTTYFSGPEKLEIEDLPFTTSGDKPTRREALRYYRRVVSYFGIDVRQFEEVVGVEGAVGDFRVTTTRDGLERAYRARAVCVSTGYFDNPRRLSVPGADLPKVSYYFGEPFPYFQQDVLVVGAGNSAVDAALTCWREGARVTLVHIFDQLDRGIKPWVRPDIENRILEGSIPAYWSHRVREIRPREVVIEPVGGGEPRVLPNDWILAMTGYEPDHRLIRALGVSIDELTGIPAFDPATMETDVAGVFIAGVVAAGHDANKIFIENGKLHGPLVARAVRDRYGP